MEDSLFSSDLIDQPGWTIKRLYYVHQSFSVHTGNMLGTHVMQGKGQVPHLDLWFASWLVCHKLAL